MFQFYNVPITCNYKYRCQDLPHPFDTLLHALGVARRAEASRLAGKRQQVFTETVRAVDPGGTGARIAAIEVTLDDLPNDRPEIGVCHRY